MGKAGNRLNTQLRAEATNESIFEDLYLAAFSRAPSSEESQKLAQYVAESEDRKAALEDVYWSVLNSKEFVFTH
jgi:hypothetical protein